MLKELLALIKNLLSGNGISINALNKTQNNDHSQITTNSGNINNYGNGAINLGPTNTSNHIYTSSESHVLSIHKKERELEKLITNGELDQNKKPWGWSRSTVDRITTLDGKYIKSETGLWLVHIEKKS